MRIGRFFRRTLYHFIIGLTVLSIGIFELIEQYPGIMALIFGILCLAGLILSLIFSYTVGWFFALGVVWTVGFIYNFMNGNNENDDE